MRQSQGPSSEPIPFKEKALSSARYSLSKMKASELDVGSAFLIQFSVLIVCSLPFLSASFIFMLLPDFIFIVFVRSLSYQPIYSLFLSDATHTLPPSLFLSHTHTYSPSLSLPLTHTRKLSLPPSLSFTLSTQPLSLCLLGRGIDGR
jgi:hypothetical protein